MKSSLLCATLIAGAIFSQSVLSSFNYDEIEDIKERSSVSQAIESLSFDENTIDDLVKHDNIVQKVFSGGYKENAAYMFSELGNYYLKENKPEKAARSYLSALNYYEQYEDLLSFLHTIGVPSGEEKDLNAIQNAIIGH